MIKYGLDTYTELKFHELNAVIEKRDGQWVDIEARFSVEADTPLPSDLVDLTALIICTHGGQIVQIVPQDEGIDCDYQFTTFEKDQLRAYVESNEIQRKIAKEVSRSSS